MNAPTAKLPACPNVLPIIGGCGCDTQPCLGVPADPAARRAHLRALLAATTSGPWHLESTRLYQRFGDEGPHGYRDCGDPGCDYRHGFDGPTQLLDGFGQPVLGYDGANAALLVGAREHLTFLLDQLGQLENGDHA